ncbi:ABC transporter substrate-binding protein [Cohnella suwonensis]|uniref:ABC transporter substrate-binding protein n=1 Tax=Cohnella suwonensis TaxID=696072 RepID=A0ABW0LYD2_9BACL
MKIPRLAAIAVVFTMSASLVSACSAGSDKTDKDAKTTLKVMYYDERGFYQQYGMLFSALYPNIDIQVVSTQSIQYEEGKDMQKAQEDFIAEQKPDILMLDPTALKKRAEEGKLYDLDAFMKKDKYDLEGVVPGVVDYLKSVGGGKLYGLTPSFYSQAIYYNKDLFQKYGVPLPEDKMSWEQILQLAQRFPTTGTDKDRVYGMKVGYQTDLYNFGMMIGSSQGLTYINPTTKQLTLNTDSWKKAFETADKAIKSGTLYTQDPNQAANGATYEDYLLQDPFIAGKVAMLIEGNYMMEQLKEKDSRLKDKGVQNWDLVTVPVNPQSPDETTSMSLYQILAIDAKSPNAEAAWTFLSYVTGDDFARVTSKSMMNGGFPIRTKYLDDGSGTHHMAAFYSLKPIENPLYANYDKLPQQFFMNFSGVQQQSMQAVKDGKKTVAEALDELQSQGQQMLTEAIAQEKAAKANGDKPAEGGAASGGTTVVESGSVTASESASEAPKAAE